MQSPHDTRHAARGRRAAPALNIVVDNPAMSERLRGRAVGTQRTGKPVVSPRELLLVTLAALLMLGGLFVLAIHRQTELSPQMAEQTPAAEAEKPTIPPIAQPLASLPRIEKQPRIYVAEAEKPAAKSRKSSEPRRPSDSHPVANQPPKINFEHDVIPAIVRIEPMFGGEPIPGAVATGWVVNDKGWIVTNQHVIRHADSVRLSLANGKTFDAEGIIAEKIAYDVAVIKSSENLSQIKPLQFAPADDVVHATDVVFAVGNPGGARFVVTQGVAMRKIKDIDLLTESQDLNFKIPSFPDQKYRFIEHDARVFPGSDGGPLLDHSGRVIGVTTAYYTMPMVRPGINVKLHLFAVAVEAEYIQKTIAAGKDGDVKPFYGKGKPKPEKKEGAKYLEPDDAVKKIVEAAEKCREQKWLATNDEQYAQLAALAKLLEETGEIRRRINGRRLLPEIIDQARQAVYDELASLKWDEAAHVTPTNKMAMAAEKKEGDGVFLMAKAVAFTQRGGSRFIVMEVIGSKSKIAVVTTKQASLQAAGGTKWLVMGRVLATHEDDDGDGQPAVILQGRALISID